MAAQDSLLGNDVHVEIFDKKHFLESDTSKDKYVFI
jgi:hypothetical protein